MVAVAWSFSENIAGSMAVFECLLGDGIPTTRVLALALEEQELRRALRFSGLSLETLQ
jgi:hypothetical protein